MIFACFVEATGFKSFPNKRTVTWQDFFVLHNLIKNLICVRDDWKPIKPESVQKCQTQEQDLGCSCAKWNCFKGSVMKRAPSPKCSLSDDGFGKTGRPASPASWCNTHFSYWTFTNCPWMLHRTAAHHKNTRFCSDSDSDSDSQRRSNSFAVNYLKYTRLLLTVVGFDHGGFTGIFTEWRRGKTFNPQVNLVE